MREHDPDIVIMGGGLAGGLIALALRRLRPELSVVMIERGPALGGNHVWSHFASDVAADDAWLVEPLTAARWGGYDVRFSGHARTLGTPYRSLTSERLDAAVRAVLPDDAVMTGAEVVSATPTRVVLADRSTIAAGGVIDARGPTGLPRMAGGWQTFLGQMLETRRPHGLERPVVMDASVAQLGGYRFVYCLPFSPTEVFVEDTYYADTPALPMPLLRRRIADYAAARGWEVAAVSREETGVLPVIARGDFARFWPADDAGPARAGARAALVHPLTSYSLPDAVRFARLVAALPDLSGPAIARAARAHAEARWRAGGFYRLLARMLFGAAEPTERARVLERFYTLPRPLIERFYAGRSTRTDMLRVLAGRPPVPVLAALASLTGGGRPLAPLQAPSRAPLQAPMRAGA